ncbi:type IV pilus modification protein PilV [Thiohalobacter sp. IOR34]|uniref:type IV pilus modification protein PilV n=1 Tax=Thiohalobacter sp. IOR34 TaxID=3057176 RepID=UPI0025B16D11|nr:type IV pilus modification protein PilV [Thiohalobacter sp. IOR34]WJW75090.1 type IV pilus modification protein PilV [Thiohalobacter sp. IOR34]
MQPTSGSMQPACHWQRGITMIEVLVTVIVLSIGLLGLASLQANGMRFNHSAHLRSQATFLAYDIADAMRANRDNALNGAYNAASGAYSGSGSQAALDVANWKTNLASLLPSGDGSISQQNGNEFTITVTWRDDKDLSKPATGLAVKVAL